MAKYIKSNSDLAAILREPAAVITDSLDAGVAITRTEKKTFKWDPADATTEVIFQRVVTLNAAGRALSRAAWAPTNVPEVGAVVNAAQGNAAKASLVGSSTLVITSPGNATLFGQSAANLEVWMSLLSKKNAYCTHPSIRVYYRGDITGLQNQNEVTASFSFPSIDGAKIPGLGTATLIVRNLKQQTESDPFDVEIV